MRLSHPSPLPAISTPQLVPIIAGALPVAFITARLAMRLFGPAEEDQTLGPAMLVIGYVVPSLAIMAWVWFFAVWREPQGWRSVGLAPLSGHWLRVSIFTAFGCFLLSSILIAIFQPLLGSPGGPPPFLRPESMARGPVFLLSVLIMACVAAPLVEELIFRGVLYSWFRQRWGLGWAALLAALPHALLHLDPGAMPALTAMFIIFAVLYENARSLWAPVIAHGLYNFTSAVWSLSTASP